MDRRLHPHVAGMGGRPTRHVFNLRRWYRGKRDISGWDGVRRDVDLFDETADCSVFLYGQGQSQRGAAFRFPVQRLIDAQCTPLLDRAVRIPGDEGSTTHRVELYLPAPPDLAHQDALKCHIASRNFFAWLCRRPLVGHHLGTALADLLDRMQAWRVASIDNVEAVLIYADRMGYSVVEHRPDNALAMLAFAEKARVRHVWIDSFAHCTGMNADIGRSPEFEPITRSTKALITRAYLEMDLHLDRASRSLVSFLEKELSASYLGLSDGARQHLDHFRCFLQSFYVGRFGYWPPFSPTNYPKDLYFDMYDDFSCLYHLLADKDTTDEQQNKSANGGICVEQNIEAFNVRHKFNPLPYSQPMLPQSSSEGNPRSQMNLRALKFGRDPGVSRPSRADRAKLCLRAATNQDNELITQSGLVEQYLAWEDEYASKPSEKVSVADARKVRWILIYGLLQTLVSAIQAPPEVRDTTTANYPLCILTTGLPPWDDSTLQEKQSQQPSLAGNQSNQPSPVLGTDKASQPTTSTPALSIHPDCEAQSYFDYWPNNNVSSDGQSAPPKSTALKRAGTRLRKASIKRRGPLQTPLRLTTEQPELVSGRTLAELAYGDHSASSMTSSPIDTGFDFGFHQQSSDLRPNLPNSAENLRASSAESSPLPAQPSTFDDLHASLTPHVQSHPHSELDDNSSIPSMTLSHGSRETVDSMTSRTRQSSDTSLTDSTAPSARTSTQIDMTCEDPDALGKELSIEGDMLVPEPLHVAELEGKLQDVRSEAPHAVTRFTDFLARSESQSGSGSSSDASSVVGWVDRAAVVESDGKLDDDLVQSYRALALS